MDLLERVLERVEAAAHLVVRRARGRVSGVQHNGVLIGSGELAEAALRRSRVAPRDSAAVHDSARFRRLVRGGRRERIPFRDRAVDVLDEALDALQARVRIVHAARGEQRDALRELPAVVRERAAEIVEHAVPRVRVHDAAEARVRAVGLARERAPHEVGRGAVEELAQCVVDLRLLRAVDLAEADGSGRLARRDEESTAEGPTVASR